MCSVYLEYKEEYYSTIGMESYQITKGICSFFQRIIMSKQFYQGQITENWTQIVVPHVYNILFCAFCSERERNQHKIIDKIYLWCFWRHNV